MVVEIQSRVNIVGVGAYRSVIETVEKFVTGCTLKRKIRLGINVANWKILFSERTLIFKHTFVEYSVAVIKKIGCGQCAFILLV